MATEDENANGGGYGRGGFEISPDGKFLYQFRNTVVILNTADFKVVDRIELSKPDLPGMENIGFGGQLDSIPRTRDQHISLFNSSDPIVHNRVFGVGPLRSQHPPGRLHAHRTVPGHHVRPSGCPR